eukprot:CAMPEP_0175985622 /NCGR_PEP_ID=MMETSP0108-20121206/49678_1 /TAXON_ID=195067 ORGANISM="Goniomonas pacifica, Strain CCMP1869" /NCGR_SAMPLE_ID=MMETSP0108 /ASSEMBLY_ACC=CAM_ASM_000204 /LENGTH=46 /DNA_ID= /DNA_START= /DNA_END= /DNA_ORIENTATION=
MAVSPQMAALHMDVGRFPAAPLLRVRSASAPTCARARSKWWQDQDD